MNILKKIFISLIGTASFFSCTDIEKMEIDHIGGHNSANNAASEEYYTNLRAYKESAKNYGRPVAFGWFSDWNPNGPLRKGYLSSVPDSMDIISMWSGCPGRYTITPEQKRDKEFVQKVKGIKLLEVRLLSHIGKARTPQHIYDELNQRKEAEGWSEYTYKKEEKKARLAYWGITDLDDEKQVEVALQQYAKALCDTLFVSEWDGFDIDWEPGNGFSDADGSLNTSRLKYLVKEMGKYIGPKSDPEGKGHKLLCIDGQIGGLTDDLNDYVDYFIVQAYGSPHPGLNYTDPRKIIVTANFEAAFNTGGYILEQAATMPRETYKGGVGAYRFEKDYDNVPDYKWMRQAIQINQRVFNEWKATQENKKEE